MRETSEETIPADILGKLPNLQYFALVSGGRLLKGRVPILDPGRERPPAPSRKRRRMTALRMVVFALGAVLVYCLYLPSAHPPARFVEAVRREHASTSHSGAPTMPD